MSLRVHLPTFRDRWKGKLFAEEEWTLGLNSYGRNDVYHVSMEFVANRVGWCLVASPQKLGAVLHILLEFNIVFVYIYI